MNTKMILFILISLCIYFSINTYLFIRGWQVFPNESYFRIVFCALFGCLCLSFVCGKLTENILPLKLVSTIQWIGNIWFAAMIYFLLIVIVIDLLRLINHFLPFFPEFVYGHYQKIKYFLLAVNIIGVSIILIIGYIKFNHPTITHLSLDIEKETPNFKKLRIVMISDIHLGYTIQNEQLKKYINLINGQNPDIVCIAGDIIDGNIRPLKETEINKEFYKINAPLGTYAVTGNHDLFDKTGICEYIKNNTSIKLLKDTALLIDNSFYLVGREDRSKTDRLSLASITKSIDKKLPVFLMDHQPNDLQNSVDNGIDLQLSGHTHMGQFFPINLIVKKMYELPYGYKKKGNSHFYVSSGIGLWGPPFRIGTVSELCVIDVKFE